ncbi:hypothetical protein [Nonomuraea dietziae]|uniref:hypothetical protein n=1 Tax=Nonomuraea dietziae TaxID=65515 RepID=UPI0031CEDC9E
MSDQDLFARLILQRIADPEDRRLGHLVAQLTPAGAVEALRSSASLVQYAPPVHDDGDEERWAKACGGGGPGWSRPTRKPTFRRGMNWALTW